MNLLLPINHFLLSSQIASSKEVDHKDTVVSYNAPLPHITVLLNKFSYRYHHLDIFRQSSCARIPSFFNHNNLLWKGGE